MVISRLLRMAFEVSSVPLSLTVVQGSPRSTTSQSSSRDRILEIEVSASGASHLRVSSTTTAVAIDELIGERSRGDQRSLGHYWISIGTRMGRVVGKAVIAAPPRPAFEGRVQLFASAPSARAAAVMTTAAAQSRTEPQSPGRSRKAVRLLSTPPQFNEAKPR